MSKSSQAGNYPNNNTVRSFANRGANAGGGSLGGQVVAKDASTITLKLGSNGSKIVFYTNTTPVTKNVSGSILA